MSYCVPEPGGVFRRCLGEGARNGLEAAVRSGSRASPAPSPTLSSSRSPSASTDLGLFMHRPAHRLRPCHRIPSAHQRSPSQLHFPAQRLCSAQSVSELPSNHVSTTAGIVPQSSFLLEWRPTPGRPSLSPDPLDVAPRCSFDPDMTALPYPDCPDSMNRSAPIRKALLFMAVCSPFMFASRQLPMPHPAVPLVLVLGATLAFLRWEGRSPAVLGLDVSLRRVCEFAAGLGGGALLVVTTVVCARVTLPFPWVRNPAFEPPALVFAFLYLLLSNSAEELVFRGYGFERLIAGIGHWPAQLVTAVLFALFHILSGWPWQTALIGTTSGSLLFGLVFVRWKSIPAATGVHVAGNWVRELLFSDPPTHSTFYAPLAPRPWTSAEQLQAGMIFTGLVLLACVMLTLSIQNQRRKAGIDPLD